MDQLKISVMMCARNARPFIAEAIDSTLRQTYADFELIVVDDGSTDGTPDVVRRYADPRLRLVCRPAGYIASLNAGLDCCRGAFIARMDADDRMAPCRLERQLEVMERRPEVALCCAEAKAFGAVEGRVGNFFSGAVDHPLLRLLSGNFVVHPTVMLRRSFLLRHGLRYAEGYPYAEDFRLWTEVARAGGGFYVVPETLLQYRTSLSQTTSRHFEEQNETRLRISQEIAESLLGLTAPGARRAAVMAYEGLLRLNAAGLLTGDTLMTTLIEMFHALRARKLLADA